MMRSAEDFETPNGGASCRRVRFVRQYGDDQQDVVLQRQALHGRLANLTSTQPRKRGCPRGR